MESHICVAQTALAALREGYLVHVASDAVSSRSESSHRTHKSAAPAWSAAWKSSACRGAV